VRGILVDHATLTDRSFATLLKSAQIANGGGGVAHHRASGGNAKGLDRIRDAECDF
jgi:hypothetical protein